MSKIKQEKIRRLTLAGENKQPDCVPITSQIETFAYGYGGTTIEEVKKHPLKGVAAFRKCYEDFYFDAFFEPIFVHPFAFFDGLGADSYFASDDGVTAQHKEIAPMEGTEEEYKALIKDPTKFFLDVINPRKFPNLNGAESGQRKAVVDAMKGAGSFLVGMGGGNMALPILTDTPGFMGGFIEMPYDNIFDFLRGFKGSSIDMRRHPDLLVEATEAIFETYTTECEKIYSFLNALSSPPRLVKNAYNVFVKAGEPECSSFPWFFNPTHAPSFMNQQQYEKFYWPTYKKTLELVTKWGGRTCTLLEGEWGPEKLELFKDLKKDSVILYVENDDICAVKKQVGDYQAIMGGMPISLLKSGTKKECLEHTMHVYDECAPGGGFIFTTDKSLLSTDDCNPENLKAVNAFAHAYGRY
ncbi:MAG: hypothetical protein II473_05895 [Clostridia bacterium]|nr:hypothetical protein [Clostridia bacterium]MBQ2092694.1 hypothetical protein [Clostridia bacterium]MBQ3897788.1 hypothetical protein [Clostridia bacterium]